MSSPEISESERRARRNRLVIILVVVLVVFAGSAGWRLWSGRALDEETNAAVADLREQWRQVDIFELNAQYAASPQGAADLFPNTERARSFKTLFAGGGVDASYVVSARGRE